MRSIRRAARRRKRTEPTNEPAASMSAVTSLRGIAGLLTRPSHGAVLGGRFLDRAQTVLQVVEDEADSRVGPGRRRDDPLAPPDDEHAALERCRLELLETREPARLADDVRLLEEPRNALHEAPGAGAVADRRR